MGEEIGRRAEELYGEHKKAVSDLGEAISKTKREAKKVEQTSTSLDSVITNIEQGQGSWRGISHAKRAEEIAALRRAKEILGKDLEYTGRAEKKPAQYVESTVEAGAEHYQANKEEYQQIARLEYFASPQFKDRLEELKNSGETEKLKDLISESLEVQSESSFKEYGEVVEIINQGLPENRKLEQSTPEHFQQMFEQKWNEWQKNGTIDYITDEYIKNGSLFTLVATPNITLTPEQILSLAQNYGTKLNPDYYIEKLKHYSPEQLSGNPGSEQVRFSIIADQGKRVWFSGKRSSYAEQFRAKLAESQETQLNQSLPSVFDIICFHYSLRAKGADIPFRQAHGLNRDYQNVFWDLPTFESVHGGEVSLTVYIAGGGICFSEELNSDTIHATSRFELI